VVMISGKIRTAFNEQIKNELESAYLYLSMAAYFHSQSLDGMAQWMRVQTQEEIVHAMKFFDHIKDREGRVELLPLAVLKKEWASPLKAFQHALKHEQLVTSKITELVNLAQEENDQSASTFLEWFVKEQEEEEESASKNVELLEKAEGSTEALRAVDQELGKRTLSD